uniref:Uncharacterized protein n=1 Tax=Arion vulgaris TaxID=1028688 RepID=A0A0B7AAP3_9EUPU
MGQCVSNERCLVSESRQLKKEQSRFSYTYHDEQNWIRNIDENEHSHHSMPAPVEEKAAEKAAENVLQPLPSETQADA